MFLQLIIVFYGIELLWKISGDLIGYFGFGPEYEVVRYYLRQICYHCNYYCYSTCPCINMLNVKNRLEVEECKA